MAAPRPQMDRQPTNIRHSPFTPGYDPVSSQYLGHSGWPQLNVLYLAPTKESGHGACAATTYLVLQRAHTVMKSPSGCLCEYSV